MIEAKENIPRITLISGNSHLDPRGKLSFVNEFDMAPVKRFYVVSNSSINIKRGWRAHKVEHRWFYAVQGKFSLKFVKIDNWERPNPNLEFEEFMLNSDESNILCVPAGHASLIQAVEKDSRLLVFSDHSVQNAPFDDYLFPDNYFIKEKND